MAYHHCLKTKNKGQPFGKIITKIPTNHNQQFQANLFVSPIASNSNKFKFQTSLPNQPQQYNTEYFSYNNDNFNTQAYITDHQKQQYQATSFGSPLLSNSNIYKFQKTLPNQQQQYNTQHINTFMKSNSSASPITTNNNSINLSYVIQTKKRNSDDIINDRNKIIKGNNLNEQFHINQNIVS